MSTQKETENGKDDFPQVEKAILVAKEIAQFMPE